MRRMAEREDSGFIPGRNRIHQVNFVLLVTIFLIPGGWPLQQDALGADESLTLTHRGGAVVASAFGPATDLGDERVVTAGLGIRTRDISSFILRSYDAHTGTMITEDEFDLTVDEESEAAIDAGAGRVYAVGSGLDSEGGLSLLVRAYDAGTGRLLWEDELNPDPGPEGRTTAFEATGRPLLASQGNEQAIGPTAQSLYLVQAARQTTGEILWQDEFLTSWRKDQDEGDRFSLSDPGLVDLSFSIMVRTYDTATGELLWRDQFNPGEFVNDPREDETDFQELLPDVELEYQQRLVRNLTTSTSPTMRGRSL